MKREIFSLVSSASIASIVNLSLCLAGCGFLKGTDSTEKEPTTIQGEDQGFGFHLGQFAVDSGDQKLPALSDSAIAGSFVTAKGDSFAVATGFELGPATSLADAPFAQAIGLGSVSFSPMSKAHQLATRQDENPQSPLILDISLTEEGRNTAASELIVGYYRYDYETQSATAGLIANQDLTITEDGYVRFEVPLFGRYQVLTASQAVSSPMEQTYAFSPILQLTSKPDSLTASLGASTSGTYQFLQNGFSWIQSLSFTALNSPFAIATSGNTCTEKLPPGHSCELPLTFAPTASGTHTASLASSYDYSGETLSFTHSISATASGSGTTSSVTSAATTSQASLSVDSQTFTTTNINATTSVTYTLTNGGGTAATAVSIQGLASPFSQNSQSSCGTSLAAGASCTIVVDFSPSSSGTHSTTMVISYHNGTASASLSKSLSAEASYANLVISGNDFSSIRVSQTSSVTYTVTNSGDGAAANLTISGLSAPFTQSSTTCGTSLGAGANCSVQVDFSSASQVLDASATLTISYSGGTSSNATKALSASALNNSTTTTVAAVYPTNGANWLSYVSWANATNDAYSQTDAACTATSNYGYYKCIHGGELRKAALTGWTACNSKLTATDTLQAFRWKCMVLSGTAHMVSFGLKDDKRLADLINATSWKNNSISIKYDGLEIFTSSATTWHSNTITALTDNSANGASVVTLNSSGTIYTLASSRQSTGYRLDANNIAITTLGTATLQMNSSAADNCDFECDINGTINGKCLVTSNANYLLWIEGQYDGNSATACTLAVKSAKNVKFRHVSTKNSALNGKGIQMRSSSYIHVSHVRSSNDHYGVNSSLSDYVIISDVVGSNSYNSVVYNNQGDNLIVTRVSAFNSKVDGIYSYSGSRNTFAFLTAINNAESGIEIYRDDYDALHSAFFANNGASGFYGQGNTAKTKSIVAGQFISVNNGTYGIEMKDEEKNSQFTGSLILGNNTTANCLGGTNYGINNDCTTEGTSDFTLVSSTASSASSFVGKITTDDTSNSSDSSGSLTFASISDWFQFENWFRGWGRDGSAYPATDHRNYCTTSVTCRIWDMSLSSSDSLILGKSGDGSSSNGGFTASIAPLIS